jgi:hypothetical protein
MQRIPIESENQIGAVTTRSRKSAEASKHRREKVSAPPVKDAATTLKSSKTARRYQMPSGSKPGERRGGRRKGTPNKRTRRVDEIMAKAIASAEVEGRQWTPLQWMLFVLNDPNTPRRERNDMARSAAPYCHAKLTAVETVQTVKSHEERLGEIRALQAKLARLAEAPERGEGR